MAFVGGGYDIAAFDFCHVERKKRVKIFENSKSSYEASYASRHLKKLLERG